MNVNPATTLILRILSASDAKSLEAGRASSATTRAGAQESTPLTEAASLWGLLTPEEQSFFAEQSSLGPLTYGASGTRGADLPAPTGRRIDVRG